MYTAELHVPSPIRLCHSLSVPSSKTKRLVALELLSWRKRFVLDEETFVRKLSVSMHLLEIFEGILPSLID